MELVNNEILRKLILRIKKRELKFLGHIMEEEGLENLKAKSTGRSSKSLA